MTKYENIKDLPSNEQKAAVQVFIERITVYEDKIDIDVLTFPGRGNKRTTNKIDGSSGENCTVFGGGEPRHDRVQLLSNYLANNKLSA